MEKTWYDVYRKYQDEILPAIPRDEIKDVNQRLLDGDFLIHIAAIRGEVDYVNILLKAGANVNAIGEMGFTPLHYALKNGFMDIVQILLDSGANIFIKNEFGLSPLDMARNMGISLNSNKST